jgi:hypothetical protein
MAHRKIKPQKAAKAAKVQLPLSAREAFKRLARVTLHVESGVVQAPPEWMPAGLILEIVDHDVQETWRYEEIGGQMVCSHVDYQED